jgi:hypothetical protein
MLVIYLYYVDFANIFRTRKKFNSPFAPGIEVDAKLFVVTHDSKLLISAGHWDNSLQVYHIGKGRRISHICRHIGNGLYFFILSPKEKKIVSCLTIKKNNTHTQNNCVSV